MDIDDGYILWTGIWKGDSSVPVIARSRFSLTHALRTAALGNSKGMSIVLAADPPLTLHVVSSTADIVKMIDSQPDLASVIRRVRGGYLKIQGTWMPYEVCFSLVHIVRSPSQSNPPGRSQTVPSVRPALSFTSGITL